MKRKAAILEIGARWSASPSTGPGVGETWHSLVLDPDENTVRSAYEIAFLIEKIVEARPEREDSLGFEVCGCLLADLALRHLQPYSVYAVGKPREGEKMGICHFVVISMAVLRASPLFESAVLTLAGYALDRVDGVYCDQNFLGGDYTLPWVDAYIRLTTSPL